MKLGFIAITIINRNCDHHHNNIFPIKSNLNFDPHVCEYVCVCICKLIVINCFIEKHNFISSLNSPTKLPYNMNVKLILNWKSLNAFAVVKYCSNNLYSKSFRFLFAQCIKILIFLLY